MTRLTKSYIDKVATPEGSDVLHWDGDLKGFGLRVTPQGKRNFVVQGRIGSGRSAASARITIGPYGVFTVDQARDAAREHLRTMRMGIDPRADAKKKAALNITLREVADAYLAERPLKDSSKEEIERHVTTNFAAWLNKPIKDMTREKVKASFLEMRGRAPAQANQGFAILRALFNYAIHQYREDDGSPIEVVDLRGLLGFGAHGILCSSMVVVLIPVSLPSGALARRGVE